MVSGVCTELQSRLERYTSSEISNAVFYLVKRVLEGFKYHPYIFMLRNSMGRDPLYPYAHQLELLANLFPRNPIRALIGDEIGLGKTIEAIMVIKYLREVGLANRVLILVPRVLVDQWIGELSRLGISEELYQIERDTIDKLKSSGFPNGVYIASIDLAKRDEYKDYIVETRWDLIIVDEAHRVGKIGDKETQRYKLVSEIAKQNTSILLLSATPHRGKAEDYIERLRLVDPFLRAGVKELDSEYFYRIVNGVLVFRRTKIDVNELYEKRAIFRQCKFKARVAEASGIEKEFHEKLINFLRSILQRYYDRVGEKPSALGLLLVLIAKRASSSPKAALTTLNRIIVRRSATIEALEKGIAEVDWKELDSEAGEIVESLMGYGGYEEFGEAAELDRRRDVDEIINSFAEKCSAILNEKDVEVLRDLHKLAMNIAGKNDSRLSTVINIVKRHLEKGDRVVIFTEFKDTANYVYDELRRALPERWSKRIVLISSDGVTRPDAGGVARGSRVYGIEDVKEWLDKGLVDVIVSTDIAAEGLNLQKANVVIHYEPSWSPIKIVQRIGRVWRLGQKKDVYSYTVLLPVESDLKALEVLYAKLLSWYVSGIERTVPIGEELEIDMLSTGREASIDLAVFAPVTNEKGERVEFSEYKAWLEYIRGGGRALDEYISKILSILKNLKRLSEKIKAEEGDRRLKIQKILNDVLSGLYGREAEEALKKLFISLAEAKGFEVEIRGDRIFAGPYAIEQDNAAVLYRSIESIVKNAEPPATRSIVIISSAPQVDFNELILYKVEAHRDDKPFYSEVIGIAKNAQGSANIVRGSRLLDILATLVKNVFSVAQEMSQASDSSARLKADATVKQNIVYLLTPLLNYLKHVEGKFSSRHSDWRPRELKEIHMDVEEIGRIYVVGTRNELKTHSPPPPIAIEEVEKKAMEIAMEYERKCGRVPEDVSEFEHYDIKSVDPRTGEVRYIEVKGKSENDISVELTETEFQYAEKLGDSYWLYIVFNIAREPQLIAIRNPAKNAKWIEIGVKRYRLLGLGS